MFAAVTPVERLDIDNDLASLRRLEPWMKAQRQILDIPERIASELQVALYELLANTVLHGCEPGAKHRIEVTILRDGAVVRLTLTDDARAFDPTGVPEPEPVRNLEAAPIGGLGLKLVRAYSDRLDYVRLDGRNRLTLMRTLT